MLSDNFAWIAGFSATGCFLAVIGGKGNVEQEFRDFKVETRMLKVLTLKNRDRNLSGFH